MVNILLVDDNVNYSIKLANYLLEKHSNLRLAKLISDGKEAIDYLSNLDNSIDAVLLDIKLPYYNGFDILESIKHTNKYVNSVIAMSNEVDLLYKLQCNPMIFSYVNKIYGFEKISEEIKQLVDMKLDEENPIVNKIITEMKYLKYNDKLVGTKYLIDTILYIIEHSIMDTSNLSKNIYPVIAKKYNKTTHNIKCNINNATVLMNCDCEKNKIMNYFRFYDSKTEATPKLVIDTILNKLFEKEDII